jgi:hypothetical protein
MIYWDDDVEIEQEEREPQELPVALLDEPGPCCMCGKVGQPRACFHCGKPVCMSTEDYQADSSCGGWILDWWHNAAFDPDDGNEFWCKTCIEEAAAAKE